LLRDRRPWFAFEVIRGPTLEDVVDSGALPILEIAGLLRDLADILEHAHRRGVIHRGLRPDRVVVTNDRRYPLCIPDWSEAIAHDASVGVLPVDGCRAYIAPELAHHDAGGAERVDDRADMFALGAIAYRALTGALPFGEGDDAAPYVAAHEACPDAPREITAIIDSLLSFDRFDRPSAAAVRGNVDWLVRTHPELQQHAAPAACESFDDIAVVQDQATGSRGHEVPQERIILLEPRMRRPRWTPNVHYKLDTSDVEVLFAEDDLTLR
jgi:serine/threonine protein kinase